MCHDRDFQEIAKPLQAQQLENTSYRSWTGMDAQSHCGRAPRSWCDIVLCCVFFPRVGAGSAGSAVAVAVAAATNSSGRSNCRCNKPRLTSTQQPFTCKPRLDTQAASSKPSINYTMQMCNFFGAAGTACLCFHPSTDQSMRAKNPHQQ